MRRSHLAGESRRGVTRGHRGPGAGPRPSGQSHLWGGRPNGLTGLTAEKHDSLFEPNREGKWLAKFSGKERIVPDDLWPLPKYAEMLFIR